ncbi:MAG: lema protein, LemA protein [Candidatus Peregrinibacteria bacterium GW2011_GWF2_38_29]|nr:MAG: lema protein, LemA protein [Candidatus Peregrinibacteria bacterium GW2011_GWF2_38_29]HBB02412.1 LemA family protein [Candidatus Peregrinibacteria bacterium]
MSKTMKITLAIIAAVIILLILPMISTFNSLTTLSAAADGQWANVEVQLQNRWDLLPRLETYLSTQRIQEKGIFDNIAQARTQYGSAKSTSDKMAAAGEVESAISRLLVVMENYPQVKTNDLVIVLNSQAEGTENRLRVERMRFNEAIQLYNTKAKVFPSNVIAGIFGFGQRAYFELPDKAALNAPKVNL